MDNLFHIFAALVFVFIVVNKSLSEEARCYDMPFFTYIGAGHNKGSVLVWILSGCLSIFCIVIFTLIKILFNQ